MGSEGLDHHASMMLELEAAELEAAELEAAVLDEAALEAAVLDEAVLDEAVLDEAVNDAAGVAEARPREAGRGVRIAEPDAQEGDGSPPGATGTPVDVSSEQASLDQLRDNGDIATLLRRAQALRTGDGVERDLEACLEHYRAAGELGSARGQFSEALFFLSGAVVAADVSAGMSKLRKAAQAGSLRAKVYLGNAYELGMGRDSDPEKADVWYRSAARTVRIEAAIQEDEQAFAVAMAELGSIRHARALLRDESIPNKQRFGYLKKAKALGYALHQRNQERKTREQEDIAREIEEALAPGPEHSEATEVEPSKSGSTADSKQRKTAEQEPASGPQIGPSTPRFAERAAAFIIALGIVGAGVGIGAFGTEAAKHLLAHGKTVPIFGLHCGYILPTALATSLLFVALVYEWSTILLAAVAGMVVGGAGWTVWKNPAGALFQDRVHQAHMFGVVGVVVALLAIGLLGGTRRRRWSK